MDTQTYRRVIGNFATGVTVVTTAAHDMLHGMTANAVSSVSLEPLLLLVCVARDATCRQQIQDAGRFCVNILAADQEAISNLFAQKQPPEHGKLRGAAYRIGEHGTPILEGGLAHLECAVHETFPGGDHDIFLGEILAGQAQRETENPLLFFRGKYRRLGD